jgi:hypothetical protein
MELIWSLSDGNHMSIMYTVRNLLYNVTIEIIAACNVRNVRYDCKKTSEISVLRTRVCDEVAAMLTHHRVRWHRVQVFAESSQPILTGHLVCYRWATMSCCLVLSYALFCYIVVIVTLYDLYTAPLYCPSSRLGC